MAIHEGRINSLINIYEDFMETHITTITKDKETPRDKFKRLANVRLERALENIRLLENLCTNPYSYQYSNKELEHIVKELQDATNKLTHYWRVPLKPLN